MPGAKEQLLRLYDDLPFERHPMWRAVLDLSLSPEQILLAEEQHYIRASAAPRLRTEAIRRARSPAIFRAMLETLIEESTDRCGPNELDLVTRLLVAGGRNRHALDSVVPTPGSAAAIALDSEIATRGAACHLLGGGAVEHFFAMLAPQIYKAYSEQYGMLKGVAEIRRLYGPRDRDEFDAAFSILDEAVQLHGWELIKLSVRDAFVARSLHYDGMLQAATGTICYWNGRT